MHRTGIIGLGIMGRSMLGYMAGHDRFAPTAMWDPSTAAIEEAREVGTGAEVMDSADAVIAASDVVYLACPPAPRAVYALAAAEAGRSVFLEKPLGVDVAASRDLVARIESAGVPAAANLSPPGAVMARIAADAEMGAPEGIDIVVSYPRWPREWQVEADWLRLAAEGGFTREVISHFIFFAMRLLGPLRLVRSRPTWPADPALSETHLEARLESVDGLPVSIVGAIDEGRPECQDLTFRGSRRSWRITDFFELWSSEGGSFERVIADPDDVVALFRKEELDGLDACIRGEPHQLATVSEALAVQELIEGMLARA